ncbi:NAD-dependent epimerase/dehydratase family protein [Halobacillus litoralis]|uniref:NAD-dependent epimerase/dehydratase family protein n=1 Tax=Halobacillus litoralis TaxID=45668 RepID=UPI001CD2FFD7|nr:NAD-dependent epimerase/dehydratase family protein [Halobacillus litoralis]MCA0970447.1 NAD-dependent epimerase/dehydratase family protein [Halobacillus litoralis]
MKVLVTGGAGFIGSHIVDNLVNEGIETVVVDNLSSGHRSFIPEDVSFYQADLNDDSLEDIFKKERPNYVIHQAAQVDVATSMEDPTGDARTNILGTIRLLQLCRDYGIKKIVYASSCAVYGDAGDCSIKEGFSINPLSYYGMSKYTPEVYIRLFHNQCGLPFTILRYANVYGPRQTPKGEGGVISIFLEKMRNDEPVTIYGDGRQTRDFVYVKDVANANVMALQKANNEILNIGNDTKTSINELFHHLQTLHGSTHSPQYKPSRAGDIMYSRLDSTKALNRLGWTPTHTLEEGLIETINTH